MNQTGSRTASCSCGQLTIAASGAPVRVSSCHCLACQRRTGSVFGTQARFREEAVRVSGESREYTRLGDSGGRLTFHFCPHCGSTVFWRLERQPGIVAIAIGAFADPGFGAPIVSLYEQHKHDWVEMPPDITREH